MRSESEDLTIVWVHRDNHAALCDRNAELLLGCFLQIEIYCSNQILSRLRRNGLDLILDSAATVHYNFAITVASAQIIVIDLFEPILANNVAGLEAALFVSRLF